MTEPVPAPAARKRGLVTRVLQGAGNSRRLWVAGGKLGAAYLRLVRATGPTAFEPGHPFALYAARAPFILTFWHGQMYLLPFLMRHGDRMRMLISKSRDGDAGSAFLGSFGIEAIRGSGGRDRRRAVEKGAVRGFLELKSSLEEGVTVATVADVSNGTAEQAGNGVVSLARLSGRPIVPIGFATSRSLEMKSWDRATLRLPFSRAVCVVSAPVEVPRDADDALQEARRREVELRVNAAIARARELIGGKPA